jgi:hypothetical protein
MRKHSPFPVIRDRRFVFIESNGFESYVDAKQRGTARADLEPMNITELQESAAPTAGAQSQLGEDSQLTATALLPATSQQPSTLNGQRDLLSAYWLPSRSF